MQKYVEYVAAKRTALYAKKNCHPMGRQLINDKAKRSFSARGFLLLAPLPSALQCTHWLR